MKKLARVATTMFIIGVCSLAATVYTTGLPVAGATSGDVRTHMLKRAGISVAFPESWIVFDPTRQESRAQFDAAVAVDPRLAQFSDLVASASEHSVLMALGSNPDGSTAVGMGVQWYPDQQVTEPVSLLRAELEHSDVFDTAVVRASKVAGRHAVMADCTLVTDEATSSGVELRMYEFVGPRGLVAMAFAAPLGDLPERDIRAAMTSVRFIR
jgi:hypothetical protein